MPHAVVVGTDATALHLGGQLAARGFQVTLLEASHTIGGQWVERLVSDKADGYDFNATADGLFVDFPFPPASRTSPADKKSANSNDVVNDESVGLQGAGGRGPWTEQAKPNPTLQLPPDQQLLRHLGEYAQAAGLHRSIRLGCTLRRAKWQAMNGCWRLELKTQSVVQRGGGQLSADLLVVSRLASVAVKLPNLPGGELYCGTILTANDQLSGPGGAAVLDQQLRGRNVFVVGPAGPVSRDWAEQCRRHAGCGGSVVLLEMEDDDRAADRQAPDGEGSPGGPLTRLFGACLGVGRAGGGQQRRQDTDRLERFSPAQPPCDHPSSAGPGSGGLMSPERGSGTSGTLDDPEAEPDADGDLGGEVMGKLGDCPTGPASLGAAVVTTDGDGGRRGEGGDAAEVRELAAAEQKAAAGGGLPKEGGGGNAGGGGGSGGGGGRGGKLEGGRSSLRVLQGVGALLNGTHVMLTTGEEFPAEVVLLVPMGGLETSLAFLDAGAPMRASQAGGSSVGGSSFKRVNTSLAAPSLASMNADLLSCQLENLYRDMLSNSPYAPNFALVGLGPRAWEHDARTAAVQAAWLLATWTGLDDNGSTGHSGRGGGSGAGGGAHGPDAGWQPGAHAGGYLRQATPVECAADVSLRARWRREAAKRDKPELYRHRYIQQLLADLGKPLQAPSKWRCGLLGAGAPPPPEHLTRQRVAKLLGLKRLRRPRPSGEDALGAAQSPRASPSRARGMSYNGGSATFTHGVTGVPFPGAAAFERGSQQPVSREASRSSYHGAGGNPGGVRHSSSSAQALLQRSACSRMGGFLDGPARSEGSVPAVGVFPVQGGGGGGGAAAGGTYASAPPGPQMAGGLMMTAAAAAQHPLPPEAFLTGGGSQPGPRLNRHHSFNNGGGSIGSVGNNSLSFAMATTNAQLLLSHELPLYRVAEHPGEHLDDPSAGPQPPPDSGQGQGQPVLQPHSIAPSCPSSPSLALAAAAGLLAAGGSTSGSIGSLRARLLSGGATSFSAAGGGAGPSSFSSAAGAAAAAAAAGGGGTAGVLAGSAVTSPCVLGGGYGGGTEPALASVPAALQFGAVSGQVGSPGVMADEISPPQPGGGMRSLQRHRSTSRLAGVSTANSLPSGQQPQAAPNGALSAFFGRRAAAVSTSQVSFDIPQSFLTERRSQSGRPSRNSSTRRPNPVSTGGAGAGSCSTGGNGLLSRANSAVRLQLLLAAASSASRRRTAMTPASPSATSAASSDAQGYSPTTSYGPPVNAAVAAAMAAASADIRLMQIRRAYGDPQQAVGPAGGNGYGTQGSLRAPAGRTSGLGTSVSVLARAIRISNNNAHGSVSEPVAADLPSPTGSAPPSPPRRSVYGKIGDVASAQLPEEAEKAAAAAAVVAAVTMAGMPPPVVSTSGSVTLGTHFITGEQQWGSGNLSGTAAAAAGEKPEGEDGLDGSTGTRWENPRGRHHRTRRRSITLPDLRIPGGPHPFHGPYLPEGDNFPEDEAGVPGAGGEGEF